MIFFSFFLFALSLFIPAAQNKRNKSKRWSQCTPTSFEQGKKRAIWIFLTLIFDNASTTSILTSDDKIFQNKKKKKDRTRQTMPVIRLRNNGMRKKPLESLLCRQQLLLTPNSLGGVYKYLLQATPRCSAFASQKRACRGVSRYTMRISCRNWNCFYKGCRNEKLW